MAIFEQIGEKITGVTQNVTKQTKSMAESSRLYGMISEQESKRDLMMLELGRQFYEKCRFAPEPEYEELVLEIDKVIKSISELSMQRSRLKGTVICSACGAEMKSGARFCSVCGNKSITQDGVGTPERAFCKYCGVKLQQGDRYCPECGAAIEK